MAETSGVMRAEIFMLALGQDEAAEVMRHLGPREVQKLGAAMATLTSVDHEEVESALAEFVLLTGSKSAFGADSYEYIRSVLTKALGDDVAIGLLDRISQNKDANGIESLKWMDAKIVGDLLHNEHPQIIATILVHLEPDQASEILAVLDDNTRQDVMLRIATLDSVKPMALKELNDVLTKLLLSGDESLNKKQIGGVRAAAEIMNYMSGEVEMMVMDSIKTYDEEMAQAITDEMFTFDDILSIDDKGIQTILKDVEQDHLVIALKGSSDEMKNKFLNNMSTRTAELIKEEMETRGPVKLSDVEQMQKKILQVARRLAEEGQIELGGKGQDEYV